MLKSVNTLPILLLHLIILTLIHHASSESDSDRVSDLLNLQEHSPSGVIHFDDQTISRFVTSAKRRSYSLIIFFDALQLREKSELRLDELRSEFDLVASSYIKNNRGKDSQSKVFFCSLEFKESQSTFGLFGVNSLPHIRYVGPLITNLKDSEPMDQGDLSRMADSMAAFVESRTKQEVGPIERPPPVSKKQMVFLAGILILSSPFLIKKVLAGGTPLHEPKIWLAFAVFIYFFSVSGAMHNIIRKMPMFIADRNDPSKLVFFYQGSGMQLGAEGFAVGFLYTIVGLLLAFVTHFLVHVKNVTVQRGFMFMAILVSYWSVRKVVYLDNWKTGYGIHGFWPSGW